MLTTPSDPGSTNSAFVLKSELRRRALDARAEAHRSGAASAAAALLRIAMPLVLEHSKAGHIVAGYWPIQTEADPRPLMHDLIDQRREIALPVVVGRVAPLTFKAWTPEAATISGVFGTVTPEESAQTLIPDLLLVPLVGFDRGRNRLGYGCGYYDRTLQALRLLKDVKAFGIAFAAQELEEIPAERWDQPLDLIVTEKGVV